jgi:type IV fimbrial biogenesis protein FimT
MLMRATRPTPRTRMRGMTLIELLTVLTLVGILLMLALPGVGAWMRDARVRTISEEVANALRLAQAEAVARNRRVAFVRTIAATPGLNSTPSNSGSNWYIQVLALNSEENPEFVQGGRFGANDTASISGPSIVCFNSVGRVISISGPITTASSFNCTAPTLATDPTDLDVTLTGASAAAPMRVEVFLGGRTRLCKPSATGQVNACTP